MEKKSKLLYEVIMDHLLKQIQTNKLEPGDRIPTELELADTFKVSRITAMRAVKELEQRGIVFRKKAKGTFVSEREQWAQSGESGRGPAPSIVSIVFPFGEQFGYDILHGAEKAAQEFGYYVTFHNSMNDPSREKDILQQLRRDGVKGIVLYPCTSSSNIDVISDLLIDRYPFTIIDRNIIGIEVPHVVSNNYQGGYQVTAHLIGLGHRKIAFLCRGMKEMQSIEERYRGYCKALIDAGITLRKEWVIDTMIDFPDIRESDPHYQDRIDQAVLDRWWGLPDRPTAVVALNDVTAFLLLKAAGERGIRVPEQLSITGFDNLPFVEHLDVALTTVEQSFSAMGEHAVAMLLEQIHTGAADPVRRIVLDTRLIVRQSTAPPSSVRP